MKKQQIIIRDQTIRDRTAAMIGALNPQKLWLVTWQPYVKRRSKSQNDLMWSWIHDVVDIVGDHTGHDADDIHTFFKHKFLPASGRKPINMDNEFVERFTTTNLSTSEMCDYMTQIEAWVTSELGLILPYRSDSQYH